MLDVNPLFNESFYTTVLSGNPAHPAAGTTDKEWEIRKPRRGSVSYFYEDFGEDFRFRSYSRTITEGDLSLFCALVGYHVPLFIDEHYARTTSFGGRICPSHLIMSISTGMTESLFRDGILGMLGLDGGRFFAPVRLGDTIHTVVSVVSRKETSKADRGIVVFQDEVFNQDDILVFQMDKTALIKRRNLDDTCKTADLPGLE